MAVVSFHSLEDRIVKNFLSSHSEKTGHVNKYAQSKAKTGLFEIVTKKPIVADAAELKQNPRAHSAKLRVAIRTEVSA